MIDVVVLGCGPIRTGEGAAAPFIGVHILGDIRPAGGFVTLAESRWEDQIGPSILVQKINHTTINRRGPLNVWQIGLGMEQRPCLWGRKLGVIFNALGGWKAWPIGDQAVHFHGSAPLHSSKTPQSTSDWLGGGGIVQGTEKRLRFVVCIFSELWPGGGFKASLNCNRVDEFDRSAWSLASKT
jgi:hypothetical protein